MERIPVLLDTDIGSDIDDAVALAYLLRQPRCELVGITTVTGDVQKRAGLAEVVCRAAGSEQVPIHCGRREVLVHGVGQPDVPQYEAIVGLPHRMDRQENMAVPFLREAIRARPGEITLLSIGPFSNIAVVRAGSRDSVSPAIVRFDGRRVLRCAAQGI